MQPPYNTVCVDMSLLALNINKKQQAQSVHMHKFAKINVKPASIVIERRDDHTPKISSSDRHEEQPLSVRN